MDLKPKVYLPDASSLTRNWHGALMKQLVTATVPVDGRYRSGYGLAGISGAG
jgi:hypothetical protein